MTRLQTEMVWILIPMLTEGSGATLMTGFLEASGTVLATEFANMIIYQRGYQANIPHCYGDRHHAGRAGQHEALRNGIADLPHAWRRGGIGQGEGGTMIELRKNEQ